MIRAHRTGPLTAPGVVQHQLVTGSTQASVQDHTPRQDWSLIIAIIISTVVGVAALSWSYRNDLILTYWDSQAHLNIARRVLDSRTPGIAQLGTVWLPVPHILMMPFIYFDFLWTTGLAGSAVGLFCFVITATALFLSIRLITQCEVASWIGLAVLLSNPNLLYIQTTPLTEPVLLMSMTASAYFLIKWNQSATLFDLVMAGLLTTLAVGSRYDGWFFAAFNGLLVLLTTYLRSRDPVRTEGVTLAYAVLPVYAMFMWGFYNWLIFGSPLAFQRNEFSAQAYVQMFNPPTVHNAALSLLTYSWAVLDNLGGLVVTLALTGVVIYLGSTRFRADSLVPYVFLAPYLFNILSLWLGQSVIITPHSVSSGYYNMRYGLLVIPGAALFIGYLAGFLMRRVQSWIIVSALTFLLVLQVAFYIPDWPTSVVTVAEGLIGLQAKYTPFRTIQYLQENYDGGGILIDETKELFITQAGIHMREYVGSFNGDLWDRALADPTLVVRWVVIHTEFEDDRVAIALRYNRAFHTNYTLVYEGEGIQLYKRKWD